MVIINHCQYEYEVNRQTTYENRQLFMNDSESSNIVPIQMTIRLYMRCTLLLNILTLLLNITTLLSKGQHQKCVFGFE